MPHSGKIRTTHLLAQPSQLCLEFWVGSALAGDFGHLVLHRAERMGCLSFDIHSKRRPSER